jgi:hypothetical protein
MVMDTLGSLGVPISFQKHTGDELTYITFFEYLQKSEAFADNIETSRGHYIQIDVWSKDDYNDLVNSILYSMKQAGFKRTTETELYEEETQTYHKVLRFFYEEEVS